MLEIDGPVWTAHRPNARQRAKRISPSIYEGKGRHLMNAFADQSTTSTFARRRSSDERRMRRSRPHNKPRKMIWWTLFMEVHCAPKTPAKKENTIKLYSRRAFIESIVVIFYLLTCNAINIPSYISNRRWLLVNLIQIKISFVPQYCSPHFKDLETSTPLAAGSDPEALHFPPFSL